VRAVVRKEYQVVDLNESDKTDDGAIASLMDPEDGSTVDDLRIPLDNDEYTSMVTAIRENMSGAGKDVYVTTLEAMGTRRIMSQFLCK
jgi:hypothetical protein